MNIRILNMQLLNFKGVRNLNIDFGDVTNISGDNATGKTSIFDAFTWLLFGKNSEDAKDFNIKTLDKFNQPIHKLEHEVTATLDVDGREMKFKRVLREKWVKKRGQADAEFTGHETEFFVDDVPLQAKEYQARVDFVMNENIAKMITSPVYFNQLKWQDRRGVLEAMAGTISNEEIAGSNPDFKALLAMLGNDKLSDLKRKISAKKGLLKASLETIPTRIDEAQRSKPESEDYNAINTRIRHVKNQIDVIDAAIENKTAAYELEYKKIQGKQQEKHELEMKLAEAKQKGSAVKKNKLLELNNIAIACKMDIANENNCIERNLSTISANQQRIDSLMQRNNKLREDWTLENAKILTIDDNALNCPTCKQLLPETEQEGIKERLTKNFNESKQAALNKNVQEGKSNKQLMDKLLEENAELTNKNIAHSDNISSFEKKLKATNEDIETVKGWPEGESKEAAETQKQIDAIIIPASPVIDNGHFKEEKLSLQNELNELNKRLATKEQIEKIEARIAELEEEQLKQSQELADLERIEFSIEKFSKLKIDTITERTNGKFKLVKFKMFQTNINGGVEECCECMVNGVPYSDVNTAGKIQAGIDIINALTEHYNINAPVFIDNRESIVSLPECKSQIINLIVVKGMKLTITSDLEEAVAS
jgi:exonuclease SbcC